MRRSQPIDAYAFSACWRARFDEDSSLIQRAIGVALLLSCAALAQAGESPLLGKDAPDFALRATSGGNVRLSEARGQVVVLSFYGSRCNACRAQLAQLDEVFRTYQPAGLVVYGVSIDDEEDEANEFARSVAVQFPMLSDPSKSVGRQYDIDRLPTVVIIDRAGKVRYLHPDPKPRAQPVYTGELRRLLDE